MLTVPGVIQRGWGWALMGEERPALAGGRASPLSHNDKYPSRTTFAMSLAFTQRRLMSLMSSSGDAETRERKTEDDALRGRESRSLGSEVLPLANQRQSIDARAA